MTNIQARKLARIELARVLKSAGLLEGISLVAEQLDKATKPAFWHGVVRNDKAKAKDSYLTWYIPASKTATRADDTAMHREVTIAIDVFSKRSFDAEQNFKLLESLENAFTENGYEVEFADETFESDTSLFHYPMTIFKIY